MYDQRWIHDFLKLAVLAKAQPLWQLRLPLRPVQGASDAPSPPPPAEPTPQPLLKHISSLLTYKIRAVGDRRGGGVQDHTHLRPTPAASRDKAMPAFFFMNRSV